jgi:hypothetical protein
VAPGGIDQRKAPRFPVNLPVRFDSAVDFITEYAENLSSNGLFVRTEAPIKALDELGVELELPGLGKYVLRVRVAHVMPAELAKKFGKPPGAGVEIVTQPAGFGDALQEYLRRLGRRRDHLVFCHDDEPLSFFGRMGYQTAPVPSPSDLVREIAASKLPVVAVVVPADGAKLYRWTLDGAGSSDLVKVAESAAELDALLGELDQVL